MKKYNNFVNEDILSNLKNVFKSFGNLISPEDQKDIVEISKEIERTKDPKRKYIVITNRLNEKGNQYEEKFKNIEGANINEKIQNINSSLKIPLIFVYDLLNTMSQVFGDDSFKPNILYKESSNPILKKVFSYETLELFRKNLPLITDGLINTFCKKSGIPNEEIKSFLGKDAKIGIGVNPVEPVQGSQPIQPTEGTQGINENMYNKYVEQVIFFVKESLFLALSKKIKEKSIQEPGFDFTSITQEMDQSQNKDSLNKIFHKVATSDKETLIKIRDFLGINRDEAPI